MIFQQRLFKVLKYPEEEESSLPTSVWTHLRGSLRNIICYKKIFNAPIPNDSGVASRIFTSSGQAAECIRKILTLQERDKSLGGDCLGPLTRPKTKGLEEKPRKKTRGVGFPISFPKAWNYPIKSYQSYISITQLIALHAAFPIYALKYSHYIW